MTVIAFDHVGIRVADADASIAFFGKLGFALTYRHDVEPVVILTHESGVVLNLIVNANARCESGNVLMDRPEKYPGHTHVALRVSSLADTMALLAAAEIPLTGGPVENGPLHTSVFIRDPDGNVIELTEHADPA